MIFRIAQVGKADDSEFGRLIEKGDSTISYKLLDHPDMTRQQMEVLAKKAAGKKIRNIANQKVNTKKPWSTE